jgi:hypothetical protein
MGYTIEAAREATIDAAAVWRCTWERRYSSS